MSPKTATSMRGAAVLAILCAAATPAIGQQPAQEQEQQEQKQHTVRKGDTLWDLAQFYLRDPFRWPLIYDANRSVVEDPHWIYPLERLVIPGLTGDPRLVPSMSADAADFTLSNRTRFFPASAAVDQQRYTLIAGENERAPLVQPLEWLAAPWISDGAGLPRTAKVIRAADPRVEANRLEQQFHPYDKLFLSTTGTSVRANDRLLVVRLTRRLDAHGWVVEPQGILHVDSLGVNTAAATIVNQFGNLKVGDLAIPLPAVPALPADNLSAVSGGATGQVIEFLVDQPLYGTTDYAFVNMGTRQGVALGDELLAYVPRSRLDGSGGEVLPEQAIAKLRVIRVTDGTATVRVTRLHHAALERGLAVRVARKAS